MTPEVKDRIEQIRRGNVPEGYKKTQVGIIPKTWRVGSVEECIEEYRCLSNDVENIPVYSSSRKGLVPQSDYYDQREAVETNLGYKVVPPEYVTYRHMSDDDVFHFNVNGTGKEILVSSEYPVFTSSDNCELGFLIPALNNTARFRYFCKTQKLGGTRTRLYLANLRKYALALPPHIEQQKIAEILTTQDKLIQLKEKRLSEKQRQKKYLMQQFFDDRTQISEKRRTAMKMNNIGHFYGGLTGKTEKDFGAGLSSFITFKNVVGNTVIDTNILGVVCVGTDEKQNRVKKGDLFFNISSETANEVGMCAVLLEDLQDTYLNSFCVGFRTIEKCIDPLFLAYFFNSQAGRRIMYSLAQGVTRINLNKSAFANSIISIPEYDEQIKIAGILSLCDKEIALLRLDIEQEKQKKKALMQLLLTGIVRVNV